VTAASGVLFMTADEDRSPVQVSIPQAYLNAGAEAAVGALIALCGRPVAAWTDHRSSQLVEPSPSRFVPVRPELALRTERAHCVLLARDRPTWLATTAREVSACLQESSQQRRRLESGRQRIPANLPSQLASFDWTRTSGSGRHPRQRSSARCAGYASSIAKRFSNSSRLHGKSSLAVCKPVPTTTGSGYLSQSDIPLLELHKAS
jgi:hypothetical protein